MRFERAVDRLATLDCMIEDAHPAYENPERMWWMIAAAESYASEVLLHD
jgi:hypothetical protein